MVNWLVFLSTDRIAVWMSKACSANAPFLLVTWLISLLNYIQKLELFCWFMMVRFYFFNVNRGLRFERTFERRTMQMWITDTNLCAWRRQYLRIRIYVYSFYYINFRLSHQLLVSRLLVVALCFGCLMACVFRYYIEFIVSYNWCLHDALNSQYDSITSLFLSLFFQCRYKDHLIV